MTEQERKIIAILLNEMAFEGARRHFHEEFPEISGELLADIEEIGIPLEWDRIAGSYQEAGFEFDEATSVCEKCYRCLRLIRNNIIHANKAAEPDTPERLADLLGWAERFIAAVYETGSHFAQRAREIKAVMKIESF